MTEPPFDVAIQVARPGRGVYKYSPILKGNVHAAGRSIEVTLGFEESVPDPREVRSAKPPPEDSARFAVMFEGQILRIDVTDMLEAIVAKALEGDGPKLVR